MKCSKCGYTTEEEIKFCPICGEAMEASVQQEVVEGVPEQSVNHEPDFENMVPGNKTSEEEKRIGGFSEKLKRLMQNKLAFGGVCAGIVMIIVGIICIICVCSRSENGITYGKKALKFEGINDDKATFVSYGGELTEFDIGDYYINYDTSLDKTLVVYFDESEETLFYVRSGEKPEKIIDTQPDFYSISDDGSYVAYSDDGTLYIYNTNKKSREKATNKDVEDYNFAFSPDGKSYMFVADDKLYVCANGDDPQSLGEDKRPIAIADGGKFIYYLDDDTDYLCLRVGEETKKLIKDPLINSGMNGHLFFNNDYSEFIIEADEKIYYYVVGAEPIRILSSELYYISNSYRVLSDDCHIGLDTFMGSVIMTGKGIYKLVKGNEGPELTKVVSDYNALFLSYDYEKAVYIDERQRVYYVPDTENAPDSEVEVFEDIDVARIITDIDCEYIYCINEDDELYGMKPTDSKPVKIANDVNAFYIDDNTGYLYFVSDGELLDDTDLYVGRIYCTKNASEKETVEGGSDACLSYIGESVCMYKGDRDDMEIYILDKESSIKVR